MEEEDDIVPSSGQPKIFTSVLKNGPKIPMVIVVESIENNIVVVAVKDLS